jgi:hypothetical protein
MLTDQWLRQVISRRFPTALAQLSLVVAATQAAVGEPIRLRPENLQ